MALPAGLPRPSGISDLRTSAGFGIDSAVAPDLPQSSCR